MTAYGFIKNNVSITVFDTPGLADTTGNDEEYLRKIKEECNDFDLILFCIDMNITRFRNDDLETMKKLTITLGVQLWNHAVVVLTFANMVLVSPSEKAKGVSEKDVFNDRFLRLKKKLQEALIQIGVPEEAAMDVPFVPAGDSSEPRLADRHNWLTVFWFEAFKRMNRHAKAAFLVSNADRLLTPIVLDVQEENLESAVINRPLQDSIEGGAFEKDVGPSGPDTRPPLGGGKQPDRPPQNQIVSTSRKHHIQLDGSHYRSIVEEMVGDVTGPPNETSTGPACSGFYLAIFNFLINTFRRLFRHFPKKKASKKDELSETDEKQKKRD